MSDLTQAVAERITDFKAAVKKYKIESKMTEIELAGECEISMYTIHSLFRTNSTPNSPTLLKISMATGIAL